MVKPNYKNITMPVGSGLLYPWVFVLSISIAVMIPGLIGDIRIYQDHLLPLTILIIGSTLVGFIDDVLSKDDTRGLFRHFSNFINGKITSGSIKALFGLVLAFFVSSFLSGLLPSVVGALIIALSMNAINILDLRPGRALTVYIFLAVILLVVPFALSDTLTSIWHFQLSLIMPAIVLLVSDLNEKSMLGDTGSNTLGAILGFVFIATFDSLKIRLIVLAVLIVFNFVGDRWSITKFIEKLFGKNE
jgi:UDP-N-acetylmuramyl pentapeptide phosphotransferase/UDP-N-acetylglucosamine-1-phosphate transferase